MKRRIALLISVLLLAVSFSGCSIVARTVRNMLGLSMPEQTAAWAEETEAPEETPGTVPDETAAPEATATDLPECASEYVSARLGLAFTVPMSWQGKFRVEEGDDYLAVYFLPEQPIEDGMGRFFTILKKTSDDDEGFFDNEQEITVGGVTYLVGMPTDVTYSETDPEYSTFDQMRKDLPGIWETIREAE